MSAAAVKSSWIYALYVSPVNRCPSTILCTRQLKDPLENYCDREKLVFRQSRQVQKIRTIARLDAKCQDTIDHLSSTDGGGDKLRTWKRNCMTNYHRSYKKLSVQLPPDRHHLMDHENLVNATITFGQKSSQSTQSMSAWQVTNNYDSLTSEDHLQWNTKTKRLFFNLH